MPPRRRPAFTSGVRYWQASALVMTRPLSSWPITDASLLKTAWGSSRDSSAGSHLSMKGAISSWRRVASSSIAAKTRSMSRAPWRAPPVSPRARRVSQTKSNAGRSSAPSCLAFRQSAIRSVRANAVGTPASAEAPAPSRMRVSSSEPIPGNYASAAPDLRTMLRHDPRI